MAMAFWMIVALVAGAAGLAAGVAWMRARRTRGAAQDPQNIYPLW
jgi:hypothetical protein